MTNFINKYKNLLKGLLAVLLTIAFAGAVRYLAERETQFKADINILKGDLKVMEIEAKIKQRKRFWGGVKVGVVGTLVAGSVAGFLIMNSK